MKKAAKVTALTTGIIGFVALLFYILFIYPYPKPHAYPIACHHLFHKEANNIKAALAEYLSEPDNVMPTLNELIAMGLYTLPQDRKFKGNYPKYTHDLRVKLILSDDWHNWKDWKILVTSTGELAAHTTQRHGWKTLIIRGWDDREGEWLEEHEDAPNSFEYNGW